MANNNSNGPDSRPVFFFDIDNCVSFSPAYFVIMMFSTLPKLANNRYLPLLGSSPTPLREFCKTDSAPTNDIYIQKSSIHAVCLPYLSLPPSSPPLLGLSSTNLVKHSFSHILGKKVQDLMQDLIGKYLLSLSPPPPPSGAFSSLLLRPPL